MGSPLLRSRPVLGGFGISRSTLFATAAALLASVSADPAAAASAVTFVSGKGVDTGACTRTAPCRTFHYAIDQTSSGGLVSALDPAGYGAVTITKAISIIGPGTGGASITARSGAGITLNTGPNDTVILRGIEIDGGDEGINITSSVGSLVLTDSVISGATYGIESFSGGTITVTNSTITNSGSIGLYVPSNTLFMTGSIVRGAGDVGVSGGAGRFVDCAFVNSGTGLSINGTAFVKESTFTGNGIGLTLAGNSTVSLDRTTITGNGQAVQNINSNSTVYSYGNNNITDSIMGPAVVVVAGD